MIVDRIRMSATPVFTVTQNTGEFPYLTDVEDDGTRVGYFFTEKREAEAVLKDVRANQDPSAIVSSIPMDRALEVVQQPEFMGGGKFRLLSSQKQMNNADELLNKLGRQGMNRKALVFRIA